MTVTENTAPRTATLQGIRVTGIGLAVATAAWALSMTLIGDHEGFGWQTLVGGATAIAFQIAIIRLLLLQVRTNAMGTGRVAKGFYIAQFVFMAGALVSSTFDAFWLIQGTAVWAAFDMFWPLSMLGMVGIGVRIAIAGRWTGIVRWWTLWAQSWFVAAIPVVLIARDAGQVVGSVQLIAGYVVLGIILAKLGTVTPK